MNTTSIREILFEYAPPNFANELIDEVESYLISEDDYKNIIYSFSGFPKEYISSNMLNIFIPRIDNILTKYWDIFRHYLLQPKLPINKQMAYFSLAGNYSIPTNEFWICVENLEDAIKNLIYINYTSEAGVDNDFEQFVFELKNYENKQDIEYFKHLVSIINGGVRIEFINDKILSTFIPIIQKFYIKNKKRLKKFFEYIQQYNLSVKDLANTERSDLEDLIVDMMKGYGKLLFIENINYKTEIETLKKIIL